VYDKCILLNKMCLFAVLQQSMHCGRNVTKRLVNKKYYHAKQKYMQHGKILNDRPEMNKKNTQNFMF